MRRKTGELISFGGSTNNCVSAFLILKRLYDRFANVIVDIVFLLSHVLSIVVIVIPLDIYPVGASILGYILQIRRFEILVCIINASFNLSV